MTLDEIRNVEFNRGRGYRADEVDDFIDGCVEAMDALAQENAQLTREMKVLADKINEYRSDEDNIRGALLNAQRTGETILRDANAKAEQIIKEAEAKALAIREDAQSATAQGHEELARIQKEVSAFKSRMLAMYKEHLALINVLPDLKDEPAASPIESAPETVQEAAEEEDIIVVPDEPAAPPAVEEELKPISRFDGLKFGADYNIADDEEEEEQQSEERHRNPFRKKK